MRLSRHPFLLGLVVLLGVATGCRSFDRDWREAATLPSDGVNGRWTGTWQNTNNTHSGALRAVLRETAPGEVKARFHATWAGLSGSFRTQLTGRWEGEAWHFTGRKRIAGFLITTEGTATPGEMNVRYHSLPDTGTFTLRRPGSVP